MFKLKLPNKYHSLLLLSLLIYALVSLRYISLGFIYIEEGMILQYAQRILDGQIPYKDFYSQITPGTFYLNALALKFYDHTMSGRAIVFIEGLLISVMIFEILKDLKLERYSIVSILFFTCWGTIHWNFPYYSWDSVFFFILAALFILKIPKFINSSKKASALTVMAATSTFLCFFFKQNLGIFLILQSVFVFLYLFWLEKNVKYFYQLILFCITTLLLFVCFFAYYKMQGEAVFALIKILFLSGAKNKGGLKQILTLSLPAINAKSFLFFVLITVSCVLRSKKMEVFTILSYLIYSCVFKEDAGFLYLYDIVFIYLTVVLLRGFILMRKNVDIALQIAILFALTLMYSNTMAGANFGRKIVSLVLGYSIFLPMLLTDINQELKAFKWQKVFQYSLILFLAFFLVRGIQLKEKNLIFRYLSPDIREQTATFNHPQLRGITSSPEIVKILEGAVTFIKSKNVQSGELFVYYNLPVIYYLTGVRNTLPIDFFWWDITPQEQVLNILKSIEQNKVKFILLNDAIDLTGLYRGNEYLNNDLLAPMQALLKKHYTEIYSNVGVRIYQENSSLTL